MWQRARYLKAQSVDCEPPAGFLFWVNGPPRHPPRNRLMVSSDGKLTEDGLKYETNVGPPPPRGIALLLAAPSDGEHAWVRPSAVELLPEFCENPATIPWGAWGKE